MAAKRTYGYYVLPVLAGEKFTGRIEMVTDKTDGVLVVKNFWWETGVDDKPRRRVAIKKRCAVLRATTYAAK